MCRVSSATISELELDNEAEEEEGRKQVGENSAQGTGNEARHVIS